MKLASLAAASLLCAGGTAGAVRATQVHERPLETASGDAARTSRRTDWRAPRVAMPAWNDFLAAHGSWLAVWDRDTGVPLRIFGEGIAVPGANGDGAVAEAAVRRLLAQHEALLAPGTLLKDFTTVANVVHGDAGQFRTVSLQQTWHGLPVEGAAVTFLFENDRVFLIGSTAARDVSASDVTTLADAASAKAKAQKWISTLYGGSPTVLATGDAEVLPIVSESGTTSYRVVVPVIVDLASPRGRWAVYTDAATGAAVAREQLLMFSTGTVKYHVPIRWPGDAHEDAPAAFATHHISGSAVTADASGVITWTATTAASVSAGLSGTYVAITNGAGALATTTLSLSPGGSAVWNPGTTAATDAQLDAFIRENEAKQWVKTHLNPNLAWLGNQVSVTVNESGSCNAYSTGDDLHFFPADSTCENTGRLADVVRHETGHSVHYNSIIPGAGAFNGSLSEGLADTLASEISESSHMGIGFYFNDQPLRELDPAVKKVYPQDMDGEVHDEGEIIGETLWDLRVGMIAALGHDAGAAQTSKLYYAIMQRSPDIPGSYAEALAADDDDGNLANGTPHKCIIDAAFAAHGLADPGSATAGMIPPPTISGLTLTLTPSSGGANACPPPAVSSATVTWRLREDTATTGTVTFAPSGTNLVATLPSQPDDTVVQYQVVVAFADGSSATYPNNAADPWYETYVGPVTPIYCTDFETNPASAGWTLGGDFQWGAPHGGNDPGAAYSGGNVVGDNLAGDYAASSSSTMTSPAITIPPGPWTKVRLQYRRWLSVEDSLYDHATISADGTQLWLNTGTQGGTTQHRDLEWRFQDVDITQQAADGTVQIAYGLTSDPGLQFGGWNVDDFCVVGVGQSAPAPDAGPVTSPDAAPGSPDASTGPGADAAAGSPDAGGNPDEGSTTGGCCSTSGGMGGSLALGLLTLVTLRRKRS